MRTTGRGTGWSRGHTREQYARFRGGPLSLWNVGTGGVAKNTRNKIGFVRCPRGIRDSRRARRNMQKLGGPRVGKQLVIRYYRDLGVKRKGKMTGNERSSSLSGMHRRWGAGKKIGGGDGEKGKGTGQKKSQWSHQTRNLENIKYRIIHLPSWI